MLEKRYTAYDPFAWAYNKHWGDQFRTTPLAVMEQVLLPKLAKGAKILDLCCGTGHKTLDLSRRGYDLTGLDGSAKMLRYARRNAPDVKFILGDARSFSTEMKFDAVVCMFDSLNHMMSIEELTSAFRSAYSALDRQGLFLFDFTTEASFLLHQSGIYGFVEDDHVCINQLKYDPGRKVGSNEFTLFRLQRGAWRRSDFILEQRSYEADEVREAVTEAGFEDISTYSYDRERGLGELTRESTRAFFLCLKAR